MLNAASVLLCAIALLVVRRVGWRRSTGARNPSEQFRSNTTQTRPKTRRGQLPEDEARQHYPQSRTVCKTSAPVQIRPAPPILKGRIARTYDPQSPTEPRAGRRFLRRSLTYRRAPHNRRHPLKAISYRQSIQIGVTSGRPVRADVRGERVEHKDQALGLGSCRNLALTL